MVTFTPGRYWIGLLTGMLVSGGVGWGYEYCRMSYAYARLEGRLTAALGKRAATRLLSRAKLTATLPADRHASHQTWNSEFRAELGALGYESASRLLAPYRAFLRQRLLVALKCALPGALLGIAMVHSLERKDSKFLS